MPGLVRREFLAHPTHDGAELGLLQRSPDTEPVEAHVRKSARREPAQVLVLRALHHPEQRLIRPVRARRRLPLVLGDAAQSPQARALH